MSHRLISARSMSQMRARTLPLLLPSPLPADREASLSSWRLYSLVFVIVGVAVTGTVLGARKDVAPGAVAVALGLPWSYLPPIAVEWGLFFGSPTRLVEA
jgi:hypothetical protein